MKKLMANLEPVILAELHEANSNYPLFRSSHEGAAVIREEVEETQTSVDGVQESWDMLWHDVRKDNYLAFSGDVRELRENAKKVAAEAIQVCAMCDKWMASKLTNIYD